MALFYFRGGGSAQDLPELFFQCLNSPIDAAWHLAEGHFEPWLESMGYFKLALSTARLRKNGGPGKHLLPFFMDAISIDHTSSLLSLNFDLAKTINPNSFSSQPKFTVSPDGSGDFHNLEEALAAIPKDSVLTLRRGAYVLRRGVVLKQAVTLIGEGIDATQIVAETGDYVIRYEGDGLFRMSDLSVRWWPGQDPEKKAADVVTVAQGEIQFEHCCFSGANYNQKDNFYGAGLFIIGDTRGAITNCLITGNGLGIQISDQAQPLLKGNICTLNLGNGISLYKQSQPTLEKNYCAGNKISGIFYSDTTGGIAIQNVCYQNGFRGIGIGGQAQPTLERNTCQENKGAGIMFVGDSSGVARQNLCNKNILFGISVIDQAHPILESNHCLENGHTGIVYNDTASGFARQNTCNLNAVNGIGVDDQAQPQLERNICQKNRSCGIIFSGTLGGKAFENTCNQNGQYGIGIMDRSQPVLQENSCQENKYDGICYQDNALGTARKNSCIGNDRDGISVTGQAQPALEGNICQDNKADGIAFWGDSAGVVRANICNRNSENGISIGDNARPTVVDNTCKENKYNLLVFGNAQPVVEKNNIIYIIDTSEPSKRKAETEKLRAEIEKPYTERLKNTYFPYDYDRFFIRPVLHYPEKDYSLMQKLTKTPELKRKKYEELFQEKVFEINRTFSKSYNLVRKIKDLHQQAIDNLNLAEREYKNHAYSLFWQALESAGKALEEIYFSIWALERFKISYNTGVSNLEKEFDVENKGNNFSPFYFQEAIPDSTTLVPQYQKLLRQGLTDYEFASIWEQIKTRKTIIAGFQSLERGINSLGDVLKDGFNNLSLQLEQNARDQTRFAAIQTWLIHYDLTKK